MGATASFLAWRPANRDFPSNADAPQRPRDGKYVLNATRRDNFGVAAAIIISSSERGAAARRRVCRDRRDDFLPRSTGVDGTLDGRRL